MFQIPVPELISSYPSAESNHRAIDKDPNADHKHPQCTSSHTMIIHPSIAARYIFHTVVSPAAESSQKNLGNIAARTMFDTGSEVELIARSFVSRNRLTDLVKQSETPKTLMSLGSLYAIAKEVISLVWIFQPESPPRDLTCYVVDFPTEDLDILLGRAFLHKHNLLVV